MNHITILGTVLASVAVQSATASITTFLDDQAGWSALAGASTEIDFVSPNGGTYWFIAPDYYASLGIQLSTKHVPQAGPGQWYGEFGNSYGDHWQGYTAAGFSNDAPAVNFFSPRRAFAYSKTSGAFSPISIDFFYQGNLLSSSTIVTPSGTPEGIHSYGWVTSFDFDRIVLGGDGGMDSVYITTIPAPSGVGIIAIALTFGRRRRH